MKKPDRAYFAIIQARTCAPGVMQQVLIDPAKVKDDLIRFDFAPGVCEYHGWSYLENIEIVTELGDAVQVDGKWQPAVAEAA